MNSNSLMKFLTLLILSILVGCTNDESDIEANTSASNETTSEYVADTVLFEGNEYIGINDSTYRSEIESINSIILRYSNGVIKSVEHYDEDYCGVATGIHKYYNQDSTLVKTIMYHNWAEEGEEGSSDFSMTDVKIVEYYSNGSKKAEKQTRGGFQDVQHEVGIWKEFDEEGKLISSKDYGGIESEVKILDIQFIENLESGWRSSYKDTRLVDKGFVTSPSSSDDLKFKNLYDNSLVISNSETSDGASSFKVVYVINSNQLTAFNNSLSKSIYVMDDYVTFAPLTYKKKGLGTYASKTIEIDFLEGKVTYSHYIGKELQTPPLSLPPPSITIE
jgi:hypothetical protein